jgi:thiopurine S-methyltransferase
VKHLATLLPAGARGLLLTLETPQPADVGPPFAVPEEEVRALFSAPAWREPRLLERQDVTAEMRARGREDAWARESLYALERI